MEVQAREKMTGVKKLGVELAILARWCIRQGVQRL